MAEVIGAIGEFGYRVGIVIMLYIIMKNTTP